MPPVFRPVSPAFLATLRACTWESPERLTLATSPPIALRVCVGEGGAWALGTDPREPRSMSRDVFEQLIGSTVNEGGSLVLGGRAWALFDAADGWATPGEVPPPPPPPR